MTALSLQQVVTDALAEVGAEPRFTETPKAQPRETTWIGTERAFGIRHYATGRSVYFVQTRMADKLRTVTIAPVAVITRHQAERRRPPYLRPCAGREQPGGRAPAHPLGTTLR